MRVLLLHNYYQHAGGEDMVFADDAAMLEANGHTVLRYTVHNQEVQTLGRLATARKTIWNGQTYNAVGALVRENKIDVVHAHNTFPLLSPAVYYAARRAGAAVVQTLHNYRFACANGLLYRGDSPCQQCVGKAVPLAAITHGCYRGSRAGSATHAAMLVTHRAARTYRRAVDAYICLTDFAREIFIRTGLPEQKLFIKPNVVHPDPGMRPGGGGYAAFVGRLGPEKGLPTLLAAWGQLHQPMPLKIVGDGPLLSEVQAAAAGNPSIQLLGRQTPQQVADTLGGASFLVFPSVCYEGLPKTILEAYATGTPVVTAGHGAMATLVTPNKTGLHFRPQDAADLARQVDWCAAHPGELHAMRLHARNAYLAAYTMPRIYQRLMEIYAAARHPAQ